MKLRNKRTGEVKDFALVVANSGVGDTTLAELNEEWEDCEELKKYYYITSCGEITHRGYRLWENESIHDKKRKEIGNYFETEEEAEKAVEKLKAWKRLKDSGISFEDKVIDGRWYLGPKVEPKQRTFDEVDDLFKDVMFIFGGEE